jgi:hypothetical protein
MKIIIYLGARQVGKTTRAIEKFLENKDNSLLVTINSLNEKTIRNKIFKYYKSHITSGIKNAGNTASKENLIDNLILDEFFFWGNDEKQKHILSSLIPCLRPNGEGNIYIYSSMKKSYNNKNFLIAKQYRGKFLRFQDFKQETYEYGLSEKDINEIWELMDSILTHPDATIINIPIREDRVEEQKWMDEEQYKVEILNKWLYNTPEYPKYVIGVDFAFNNGSNKIYSTYHHEKKW